MAYYPKQNILMDFSNKMIDAFQEFKEWLVTIVQRINVDEKNENGNQ